MARAGVKFDKKSDDQWQECAELESLYRTRHYDLKLTQKRIINLRLQWQTESDLIGHEQAVRVNLDYDLKRCPTDVRDVDEIIWFNTEPWQSIEEFNEYRNAFEAWRSRKRRVLRTVQDWRDFLHYKREVGLKAEIGVRTNRRPPLVQLFLRCYAHGLFGLPGNKLWEAADFVSECGWPTTAQNVKDAKRRGRPDFGAVSEISAEEYEFLVKAAGRWPGFDYDRLLKPRTVALRGVAE